MNIKANKRTLLTLAVASCLTLFFAANAIGVDENDLRNVQEQLKAEKLKLKAVREKEASALNSLFKVNKNLKDASKDLNNAKVDIYENQKKIKILRETISESESRVRDKSQRLKERIAEAYKSGRNLGLLEIIFSSSSVTDLLKRSYYLEKIIGTDVALISDIRKDMVEREKAKTELQGSLADMQTLAERIEERKGQIQRQAEEKKTIYQSLHERRKEYEKRVAELEKSSRQFESLILKAEKNKRFIIAGTGQMMWPAPGRVLSGFGYRRNPMWGGSQYHTGIDIGASYGEPVRSADNGEVIFSGWWDGYGKAVVLDHGGGVSTVYGHMSRIYVEAGQKMEKGQVIGLVGSTGFSTGPHLHFEVRRNGKPVDPMGFLI